MDAAPTARHAAARQATGHPPPTLDWRDPNAPATVRAHLRSSVPLGITHAPPWVRTAAPHAQRTASSNANITIDTFFASAGSATGCATSGRRAAARFRGKHVGFAHMDYFASFNVYDTTGTKRVQLVHGHCARARSSTASTAPTSKGHGGG